MRQSPLFFGWLLLDEVIGFETLLSILFGFFGVVLATIGYVLSNLMARHLIEVPAPIYAVMMLFFIALVMAPVALLFETPAPQSWPRHIWQAVTWLGLISTGLAVCLRLYLICNVGAGYASFVGYLIPLFSVLLGALILHEPLGPTKVMATVIILLGLGLTQKAHAPSLLRRQ